MRKKIYKCGSCNNEVTDSQNYCSGCGLEFIGDGVVPKIKDKVKILIGKYNWPDYYGLVKKIEKRGTNEFDVILDIYNKDDKLIKKDKTVSFDYLTVI